MAMEKDDRKKLSLVALGLCCFSANGLANESPIFTNKVQVTPRVTLEEIFSDNVNQQEIDDDSSWVTLFKPGINAQYLSPGATITLDTEYTRSMYTHDHSLDENYYFLDFTSQFQLYLDGLSFVANATIDNVNQSDTQNALSDLVTGDTAEEREYELGFRYDTNSNKFNLNSALLFSKRTSDDNRGEREGYRATLNSQNGISSRNVFWDLGASYSDYDNDNDNQGQNSTSNGRTGRYFTLDAQIGLITDYKINPFIRYYDEDSSGNLNRNQRLGSSSVGAGARWFLTQKSYIDLAYNWADDGEESSTEAQDDYVSTTIVWKPNKRVDLKAKYYQRFYDDAYDFKYRHQLKRFTLNINYKEEVELFDRYENQVIAAVYCPEGNSSSDLSGCLRWSELPNDHNLVPNNNFTVLVPGQTSDFVLNKTLGSTLTFRTKRSTYSLKANRKRRENLQIDDYDTYDRAGFSYSHQTTRQSTLTFDVNWRRNKFDNDNSLTLMQIDHYRTYKLSLQQNLREAFSITYSLRHLNRNSTRLNAEYEENRASVQLVKEF